MDLDTSKEQSSLLLLEVQNMKIYTTLYRDREIHPSVEDLQSTNAYEVDLFSFTIHFHLICWNNLHIQLTSKYKFKLFIAINFHKPFCISTNYNV